MDTNIALSDPPDYTLQQLIEKLHILFSEERVNVEEVHHAMSSYKPKPLEWRKYANFDQHRYTRNLVDEGNGNFNLIVLCWGEGQGSSIHDHMNSHCFMKVLEGNIQETLYGWPSNDTCTSNGQMDPLKTNQYGKDQVAYINDSIGLHRVENNSHSTPAVTLHLYSPPINICQSFDERTGKTRQCKVTFWSKFGVRTPFGSSSGPYDSSVAITEK